MRVFRNARLYVFAAIAVWLAWEVIKVPIVNRAPPVLAIRLAPNSPEVLRRAAEQELASGQAEDARALSDASLARAPFDARALRVRGLAEAQGGDIDTADQLLTLAGNWSLRDDPSHAWLVERRLRQGNFVSAMAHADTLARRRDDVQPRVFEFFTTAASAEPRAIPALTQTLAKRPPWREAYLRSLYANDKGPGVLLAVALTLEKTPAPFSDEELAQLYSAWVNARRFPAVLYLRRGLSRPPLTKLLQNGDFSTPVSDGVLPFDWTLGLGAGITSEIVGDDLRDGDLALRVGHNGFSPGVAATQVLALPSGRYRLASRIRHETPLRADQLALVVRCLENDQPVQTTMLPAGPAGGWRDLRMAFETPSQNCTVQRLEIIAFAGDSRTNSAVWFDGFRLEESVGSAS